MASCELPRDSASAGFLGWPASDRLWRRALAHRPMIDFMAITNDAAVGARWLSAGIQRVMVDLETHGKGERQRHRDTVKSDHSIGDLAAMRDAIPTGHIVARCEPLTMPGWAEHLDRVLDARPTSVMLPMVQSSFDVHALSRAVDERAQLIVMIETAAALASIESIVAAAPTATFFVGLNDLHIELGYDFMFEPLARGDVDQVAAVTQRHGATFGFGGLARVGQGTVDSAAVVKEHVRLGSELVILARSFFGGLDDPEDVDEIRSEIGELRTVEARALRRSRAEQDEDTREIRSRIGLISEQMAGRAMRHAPPDKAGD